MAAAGTGNGLQLLTMAFGRQPIREAGDAWEVRDNGVQGHGECAFVPVN